MTPEEMLLGLANVDPPILIESNKTLLEAIGVLEKEIYHTNMIHWLLNTTRDEKGDYLLLDHVFNELKKNNRKQLDGINPQNLKRLKKEASDGKGGKVDLMIEWDNFILLIENKIHSSEQPNQCADYLDNIREKKKDIILIYLTLGGSKPKSGYQIKEELICLSYRTLIDYLKKYHPENKSNKNHIILKDYILSIRKILKLPGEPMKDKKINQTSEILFNNYKELYEKDGTFFKAALDDTQILIDNIRNQVEEYFNNYGIKSIEKVSEFEKEDYEFTNRAYFWTCEKWIIEDPIAKKKIFFGFIYNVGSEGKLFPQYKHEFGLYIPQDDHLRIDDKTLENDKQTGKEDTYYENAKRIKRELLHNLKDIIRKSQLDILKEEKAKEKHCRNIIDDTDNKNQHHWLIYCQLSKDTRENIAPDKWGDEIVKIVGRMANDVIPIINENLNTIRPKVS